MPLELYLLDTDICSYLLDVQYSTLRDRVNALPSGSVAISAVTQAEIWFGLNWKAVGLRKHNAAVTMFDSMTILPWPVAAAPIYGSIRARLKRTGLDVGRNDVMIAAHAIALDATLVTNNRRHFSRIGPPLRLENWA